jgi:predicted TIM-barrel fold metal-dependent hydrolase
VEQHGLDAMVAERSRTLNHPNIWRRVLEKYPELYLNLAHFGGQADMCLYAGDNHDSGHGYIPWSSYIVELMEEYPNVYTDVACYNDSDAVGLFKKQIYDAMLSRNVKRKVMYGSDYNVLMLSESSVSDYLRDFKRIFGNEFEKIARDNPNRFLFERE